MKTEMKDSAGVRIPPPVFFSICLGAGLWLESVFPGTAMQMPSMFRLIPGLVLTVPVLYALVLFLAIKPEERYLTRKFGKEYTDYAARVRRWI